jgi:tetratricopeptide (TPR) repeat protein
MFGHAGFRALHIIGVSLLLTATQVARADPEQEEHLRCPVSTREQARSQGDLLFEQGAYRRAGECYQAAGECYQAAGEYALANRAFLKALEAESAVTARRFSDQRDQAKTMLRNVQQAFRVDR